jgi:hypothetical protein
MKMILTLLAGVVATIAILRLPRDEAAEKKKKIEEAFAIRPQQSPSDFYAAFFKTSGVPEEVVVGVLPQNYK